MPETGDQTIALPSYDVQLADTYLLEAKLSRGPQIEGESVAGPTAQATISLPQYHDENRRAEQVLSVKLSFPYRNGELVLTVECAVIGVFLSETAITAEEFSPREAMAVLWPYVRATVGELTRMTGLPVPPIPTLDVVRMMTATSAPPAVARPARRRSPSPSGNPLPRGPVPG